MAVRSFREIAVQSSSVDNEKRVDGPARDVEVFTDEESGHAASGDNGTEEDERVDFMRHGIPKRTLIVAYTGLVLAMFANRFSLYSYTVYSIFATSAFSQQSLLSAAGVVSNIAQLCAYPIIAKLKDVIGVADSFTMSVIFQTLAAIMYAGCPNIETYLVAGIFNSIGNTGMLLMAQIFVAETTSLQNRALLAALPESATGIVALYITSAIADKLLKESTWRWGYGMFAIIFPACAILLLCTLYLLSYRAKRAYGKRKIHKASWNARQRCTRMFSFLYREMDFVGAFLLVASLSLLLIPLSLTSSKHANRWNSPAEIAMLVVGVVVLIIYGVWDAKFATRPIVPLSLMKHRSVVVACVIGGLEYLSYSMFTVFFQSFLQVAGHYSPSEAAIISNTLAVSFQAGRIGMGVLLRLTKRPQPFIYFGIALCILGRGLMIYFCDMPGGTLADKGCLYAATVIAGIGRGIYHTAGLISVQALVSESELSVATSLFLAINSFGSAIGESMGGAIWRNKLRRDLVEFLPASTKDKADAIFGSVVIAKKYPFGSATRLAIDHAYRDSMQLLTIVSTAMMAPMLGLALLIKPVNLSPKEEDKPETTES